MEDSFTIGFNSVADPKSKLIYICVSLQNTCIVHFCLKCSIRPNTIIGKTLMKISRDNVMNDNTSKVAQIQFLVLRMMAHRSYHSIGFLCVFVSSFTFLFLFNSVCLLRFVCHIFLYEQSAMHENSIADDIVIWCVKNAATQILAIEMVLHEFSLFCLAHLFQMQSYWLRWPIQQTWRVT